MKSTFIFVFTFLSFSAIFGQQLQPIDQGSKISKADSVWFSQLPELKLPEENLRLDLPSMVDNSEQPYLRPVFQQNSASCGQSAGIGYNFTYEIDRARNLMADTSINQYPTHFAWNFMNYDSWYGVSYLHSFEILRTYGCPTAYDYGGLFIDEGLVWITGYEKYYNGMKNRIRQVYQIPVNTPEGLLTLKHWLHNHLDGSDVGGVASFYAVSPWGFTQLPDSTPEVGSSVITAFQTTSSNHAMTIVGYNDSIRFDYNADGQYTNDIDINEDGVVDMKDWEIGGVKFVNSYGDTWADSGYCYLMYKLFAEDMHDFGIWNHVIHVLDVKADYEPELTLKLNIKHDSREKLKITAGVSSDPSSLLPEHELSFPVFDYQGAHNYMQGGRDEEEKKTIEIGLDITPLISYIESGDPAKFFLIVREHDPKQQGSGQIIDYSIIDYNNGGEEISYPGQNIPINENDITYLAVTHSPVFNKIKITTDELPASVAGQLYEHQLEASGGTVDYEWDFLTKYHQQPFESEFPLIDEELLAPVEPWLDFAEKEIEFEFPFYNETFSRIYIHREGFIMFDDQLYPWPYYNDPFLLFKRMRNISVFLSSPIKYYEYPVDEDGIWYEGDENHAAFRWNQSLVFDGNNLGHAEFAVILYPDGRIEYFYNDIQVSEDLLWYGGVSDGDNGEYQLIGNSNTALLPGDYAYSLIPEFNPSSISLDNTGLLSGTPEMDEHIYNLTVSATDDHFISSKKTFQFSDGLIYSYEIDAGGDTVIQYGETVHLDITIKNIYSESFHNVNLSAACNDPYVALVTNSSSFGDVGPGESVIIDDAISFIVNNECPDRYNIQLEFSLDADEAEWTGNAFLESLAPSLCLQKYYIVDGDNNKLDPGETVDLYMQVTNSGSAIAASVEGLLQTSDPYLTILAPTSIGFGDILPGQSSEQVYSISADENTPIGYEAIIFFEIETQPQLVVDETFSLFIGQFPVLIINRSQNDVSKTALLEATGNLGIQAEIADMLPANLDLYRSIFLCMGSFYENNVLTDQEGVYLAMYLDNGGKLYMEGTVTWYMDPETAVHKKFSIDVVEGSWTPFDGITGVDGTFTEGMYFGFTGAYPTVPYYFDYHWPAFSVFKLDDSSIMNSAVAKETAVYKTIASMFEFGLLETENTADDRKLLMEEILEFFDLGDFIVNIIENNSNEKELVETNSFPNPFTVSTRIEISLANPSVIDLTIVDLSGQVVATLVQGKGLQAGTYQFDWDGRASNGSLSQPGFYLYQVRSENAVYSGKMVKMY